MPDMVVRSAKRKTSVETHPHGALSVNPWAFKAATDRRAGMKSIHHRNWPVDVGLDSFSATYRELAHVGENKIFSLRIPSVRRRTCGVGTGCRSGSELRRGRIGDPAHRLGNKGICRLAAHAERPEWWRRAVSGIPQRLHRTNRPFSTSRTPAPLPMARSWPRSAPFFTRVTPALTRTKTAARARRFRGAGISMANIPGSS